MTRKILRRVRAEEGNKDQNEEKKYERGRMRRRILRRRRKVQVEVE
jgi:hypothetical protein